MCKEKTEELVCQSKSKAQLIKKLGLKTNGSGFKYINALIEEKKLDISHFDKTWNSKERVLYPTITKNCPICKVEFKTKEGHKKEKTCCSKSCSNTYFRSGINNPNWKPDEELNGLYSYKIICFRHHERKCVVCGENKIVDVHHFDENKNNDNPMNLIPLCPTHHTYWHSRYRYLIKDKVLKYVEWFKEKYIG